jgi:hypothetical protein
LGYAACFTVMVLFWDLLASRTEKKIKEHFEQTAQLWRMGGLEYELLYHSFISSSFLPILTNCLI